MEARHSVVVCCCSSSLFWTCSVLLQDTPSSFGIIFAVKDAIGDDPMVFMAFLCAKMPVGAHYTSHISTPTDGDEKHPARLFLGSESFTITRSSADSDSDGDDQITLLRSFLQGYVYVDAHVLCTPIIADINADGDDEIIFAVSYYFDRDQYSDPAMYEDLDVDVKINKYVAGGVAVYDLTTKMLKWHTHLDLTTDETMYRWVGCFTRVFRCLV